MASVIINMPGYPFQNLTSVVNIAALREISSANLQNGQDIAVDYGTVEGDSAGGLYSWSATSMAADNGDSTVRPNDLGPLQAGRWLRSTSSMRVVDSLGTSTTLAPSQNAITAGFGAGSGAGLVGFQRNASNTTTRSLLDKASDWVSLLDFKDASGAVPDATGARDATLAIQRAIDERAALGGGTVVIPFGTYLCNSPIIIKTGVAIMGMSRNGCTLKSGVIGDSLIKIGSGGAQFIGVSKLKLQGNGLTGSSGNGHALDMIDPDVDSGTHWPQHAVFEDLYITEFKGIGREQTGTMDACGIAQIDGLAVHYNDVTITNCGQGVYLRLCQNTHLFNVVVDTCTKYALVVYDTENVTVIASDFVNCGDGVAAVAYPVAGALSANIWDRQNEGLFFFGCKTKDTVAGKACIVMEFANGTTFQGCWIYPSITSPSATVQKGIYGNTCSSIKIIDNWFSPANVVGQKYEIIEFAHSTAADVCDIQVERNMVETGNFNIAYFLKISGTAISRKWRGVSVRNNRLGAANATISSGSCTVDAFISLFQMDFSDSEIIGNTGYLPANVTCTAFISRDATVGGWLDNRIERNTVFVNGGTLGATYSTNISPTPRALQGNRSGTTDASGLITVTHGLGETPSQVFITPTSAAMPNRFVSGRDATTFTVSTGLNSTSVAFDWGVFGSGS